MTLSPERFHLIKREYPLLTLCGEIRGLLFSPRPQKSIEGLEDSDENYDLVSKAYIMMKRLHQSYREVLLMDEDDLNRFFSMEMRLIKKEAEDAEEAKRNK